MTDVPGGPIDTDTSWVLSGSPYVVQGDLVVKSGATLSIEAGVRVEFAGSYSLEIGDGSGSAGTLLVLASPSNPVTFEPSAGVQDWKHLSFTEDSVDSVLTGAIFRDGGSSYATIFCEGEATTISDVVIERSRWDGIDLKDSTASLGSVLITDASRRGLNLDDSDVALRDILISNCGSYGIQMVGSAPPVMENITIDGFGNFGIHMSGSAPVLSGVNSVRNGPRGMYFTSSPAQVANVTVDDIAEHAFFSSSTSGPPIFSGLTVGSNVGILARCNLNFWSEFFRSSPVVLGTGYVAEIVTGTLSMPGTTEFGTQSYIAEVRILGDLTIQGPNAPGLRFSAGTLVKLGPHQIDVGGTSENSPGTLVIAGEPGNPVRFEAIGPPNWKQIYFRQGALSTSRIEHCELIGGGWVGPVVRIASSNVALRYVTILDFPTDGVRIEGGGASIRRCTISGALQTAISIQGGRPVVEHNVLSNNVIGVQLLPGVDPLVRLVGNDLSENLSFGIDSQVDIGLQGALNYWGDPSGPSGAGSGSGSAASTSLLFEPWLQTPADPDFGFVQAWQSPDPLNPDGGATTFHAAFSEAADWRISVRDSNQNLVRSFSGTGSSLGQDWFGDDGSSALPDGDYSYELGATSLSGGVLVAQAAGVATLKVQGLVARLTLPIPGTEVCGAVEVEGIATGPAFDSYLLEVGAGYAPTSWTTLATGSAPEPGGLLASWDVSDLPSSAYTLRLRVLESLGTSAEDRAGVIVDALSIKDVFTWPQTIDPYQGEQAGICFTLSGDSDVTLGVFNWPALTLVRTMTQAGLPAGRHQILWDGRDDQGDVAGLFELHYYTIDAINSCGEEATHNDAADPTLGPTPSWGTTTIDTEGFDPYRNDHLEVLFGAQDWMRSNVWANGEDLFRPLSPNGIFPPRPGILYWDGRNESGAMYSGDFDFYFGLPGRVPNNPIYLEAEAVRFEAFRAQPYLIQSVLGEVTELHYSLSLEALVTITISDPNGSHLRTLVDAVLQSPGSHIVEWDGKNDQGQWPEVEGLYSASLVGTDPRTSETFTREGALMVYR